MMMVVGASLEGGEARGVAHPPCCTRHAYVNGSIPASARVPPQPQPQSTDAHTHAEGTKDPQYAAPACTDRDTMIPTGCRPFFHALLRQRNYSPPGAKPCLPP